MRVGSPFGVICDTVARSACPGKRLAAQERLLADGDAVDLLLIDLGDDLHRQRRPDPEQHVGGSDDLADLAVAPQHHAVERRAQHQLVDPHLLRRDPRLVFLGLGPALLIFLLRGVALGAVLLGAIEIALRLLVADLQLVQRAALLGIVHAAEHLAGLDLSGPRRCRDRPAGAAAAAPPWPSAPARPFRCRRSPPRPAPASRSRSSPSRHGDSWSRRNSRRRRRRSAGLQFPGDAR